jgi:uncharacterized 2Fe-2S/4Fe-4S cluster protein (DUF4445 family)
MGKKSRVGKSKIYPFGRNRLGAQNFQLLSTRGSAKALAMTEPVSIRLLPLGKTLRVERGAPLHELLFSEGVEFPCGGKGRCHRCRIKVVSGALPETVDDLRAFSPAELVAGWRLACRARAESDLTIELAQWEAPVLADDSVFEFTPRDSLGVAIDLGTTTLAAQLVDLSTGKVLAVTTALNAQAQHGADIMSRVEFATADNGLARLSQIVRQQIFGLIEDLLQSSRQLPEHLKDVVIVGNTVMHHLFCGLDLKALAHVPFESTEDSLRVFKPAQLSWQVGLRVSPSIRFLPCLGGFVGSDILAGVLGTKLHESNALAALIDLGTNGEIVVGNRDRLLCASTAAGPAFEGARISMGMRAATGAISEVTLLDGKVRCHVLGNSAPRGICGSGLVDAVAAGLELGWVQPDGRLPRGEILLEPPVILTQADIRELQLAKGAIAGGLRILVHKWGAKLEDLSRIYLAGAFGNYINRASARRIGLINFPREKVVPSGNTALLGAKIALANLPTDDGTYVSVIKKIQHVPLHEDAQFLDIFADEMRFPDGNL